MDELELELIDYGADEVFQEVDEETEAEYIMIYGSFESFGAIQKFLEEKGLEIISGQFTRIPTTALNVLDPEAKAQVEILLDKLEEDDDVQNVYHLMEQ